jgi:hypothetical protein
MLTNDECSSLLGQFVIYNENEVLQLLYDKNYLCKTFIE